jgi:amino acid permease
MNLAIKEALDFIKKEKGLTYITIGNIGSALLGAFFWFILASILKVSEYGEVNYYLSLVSIPVAIGLAGFKYNCNNLFSKRGKRNYIRSKFDNFNPKFNFSFIFNFISIDLKLNSY